jgi:diguanylate cyclase (GGDEF)-like protein
VQVVRFVSTLQNIAEKKEAEEKIRHMAQHDVLTGLPNRLLFKDRLQQAISRAKRSEECLAVLFFDLDRFKEINDSQGHEIGDQLLVEVSRRVRGMLRETDTLSRFGGDEFVIIQTDVHSREDAEILARRIQSQFMFPFSVGEQILRTSVSIGITLCPQDDTDPDQLLRNADLAMYKAKGEGRNSFSFYEHRLKSHVEERIVLEDKLRGVVGWEDFELYYQPQIDVRSGKILRVEALARWQHPVDGFIPPSKFIPLAEETGLIFTLGEWVLRTALAQVAAWEKEGLPTPAIAINVSARQFDHHDFVDKVKRSLEEFGSPGRHLELELTESMVMKAPEQAGEALRNLQALGVNALIDDFGTGYSSLAYLTRFPIQAIKIDRSFVKDLDAGRHAQTIVRAIVSLAHRLGISVVGEGIETTRQKEILVELGCDILQGFLIGPPMPAEEITRILKSQESLPSP